MAFQAFGTKGYDGTSTEDIARDAGVSQPYLFRLFGTKKQLNELQAQFTGQTVEQIEKDSDRDRWFTAQEALEYGFVDHVVSRATMTDSANPVSDN